MGWRQQPCFGDTIERSRPRATGQHVPRANRSSSYLQIHELLVTLKDSIGVRTFPDYIPNELFILLSQYLFFFFVFVFLSHHGNHASECADTRNTDIMTRYKKLHISESTVQSSKSGQRERTVPWGRPGGNQWDEEGQHARPRAHMPGHFTRVHSFTHQQDMGGRGLLCTGVKEFCVYPTTELGTVRARWQHDFRGAGPLSHCATGAQTHTLRTQDERMQETQPPFEIRCQVIGTRRPMVLAPSWHLSLASREGLLGSGWCGVDQRGCGFDGLV